MSLNKITMIPEDFSNSFQLRIDRKLLDTEYRLQPRPKNTSFGKFTRPQKSTLSKFYIINDILERNRH